VTRGDGVNLNSSMAAGADAATLVDQDDAPMLTPMMTNETTVVTVPSA